MRLTAEDLAGERGGEQIFSGISFVLDEGQAVVVTGPNGAGKSTLLRVLAGLLPLAAGSLRLEGEAQGRELAEACHYLGHRNAMKTALTVNENLKFWQDYLGEPQHDIGDALGLVGLPGIGALPFGTLSTGQRRRVAIARLLVSRRPVWLLDEPTAGLDGASEARLADLARTHLASGGIVMAATHQPLGVGNAKELAMGQTAHE